MGALSRAGPVDGASHCVVIAEFEVRENALGDFVALARRFAQACLRNEPGCSRFDVVTIETAPTGVLFHEVYDDAAAFDAHVASVHLAGFRSDFAPLVERERPLRKGRT